MTMTTPMMTATFELLLEASTAKSKEKSMSTEARAIRKLKGHVAELAVCHEDAHEEEEEENEAFRYLVPLS